MESTSASSAKTHWPSIASSNHAESRQGDVHFVGNGLWVVPVTDPDGYRMEFESPTDARQEETELEE